MKNYHFRIQSSLILLLLLFQFYGEECCFAFEANRQRITVLASLKNPSFDDVIEGVNGYLVARELAADVEVVTLHNESEADERTVRQAIKGKPDLIICLGSIACDAVLGHELDIPVVYSMIFKPDKDVAENVRGGVPLDLPVRAELKLLKRLLPNARKIGVLYNPDENGEKIRQCAEVVESMGFEFFPVEVESLSEMPVALKKVVNHSDVLWGVADKTVLSSKTARYVLLHCFRNKVPFVGLSRIWVKAGALYAPERDYVDVGAQCGEIVEKILSGNSPSEIEHVLPRKLLYSINMKTANHMKLKIPDDLQGGAFEIY